jgi:hypothetical protein
MVLALPSGESRALSTVIGGSALEAPPSFWDNSFWGITSGIDRAFPFTVPAGGPYSVDSLEIVAFHYINLSGSRATFTLHEDDQGNPGISVGHFFTSDITTEPKPRTLLPLEDVTLRSDRTYWLVGETTQGQVNWHIGYNTFGPAAYRVGSGDWTFLDHANTCAFAIHGTPIPEPATLALFGLISLGRLGLRPPSGNRSR